MLSEKLQAASASLKKQREAYALIPSIGERRVLDGVDCIVHIPEGSNKNLPVFIELHGGAWVGGDAVFVDSLCQKISRETPCVAVNLNYKKLDVHPFPYPMEEVLRVIKHFSDNSNEYKTDAQKIVICGQSAGAHIVAGAAILAKERDIKIARQILVYPFLDCTGTLPNSLAQSGENKEEMAEIHELFFGLLDTKESFLSPAVAKAESLKKLAPTDIILCGKDALKPHAVAYYEKLREANIEVSFKEYKDAIHGFLEVNRSDFTMPNEAKCEDQAVFARDCENYIIDIMRNL